MKYAKKIIEVAVILLLIALFSPLGWMGLFMFAIATEDRSCNHRTVVPEEAFLELTGIELPACERRITTIRTAGFSATAIRR